jgi:hypothetical protein
VALTACGQQSGTSSSSPLDQVQRVNQADIVPSLLAATHSQLKEDAVAGVDQAKVFAAMDQQVAPMVTDGEAELAKAPDQVGTAPNPIFTGPAAPTTAAAPRVVLMAADPNSGREYEVNKTYKPSDVATEGGLKVTGGGVFQIYIENQQVFVHAAFNSQTTGGQRTDTQGLSLDASTPYCPDASGLSRGTFASKIQGSSVVNSPGGPLNRNSSLTVQSSVAGHVNDAANLTTYDLLNLVLNVLGASAGKDAPGYYLDGYSITAISATTSPLVVGGRVVANAGARSAIHGMSAAEAGRDVTALVRWEELIVQEMYQTAQRIWKDGHCVEVVLTKGPDPKGISSGQTSSFTAEVDHKPDGAQLNKPIVAGDSLNGVVKPEGKPTLPPAQFTFTAESGHPRSTTLTSTSNRGIGKLSVNWLQPYKLTIIHTQVGGGLTATWTITGTIAPDTTNSFLIGPGSAAGEAWGGRCGGPWRDGGPVTIPVKLKALEHADGRAFDLQYDAGFGGPFFDIGTFPAAGGAGQGTLSVQGSCGTDVSTFNIQADPV